MWIFACRNIIILENYDIENIGPSIVITVSIILYILNMYVVYIWRCISFKGVKSLRNVNNSTYKTSVEHNKKLSYVSGENNHLSEAPFNKIFNQSV